MPFALTIGVPHETFMHLVPNELKAFYISYRQKKELEDRRVWEWIGTYGISAFIVAIDTCFNGEKAKAKYIEKPMLEYNNLTREQIEEIELKKFLEKNEKMRNDWRSNHKQKSVE